MNYNIGPGAIATPGTDGGPSFSLSRTEWIAIQTYSTNALALPTTQDAFRKSLGSGAPSDLSDFNRLIEAYQSINGHVTNWENNIFPDSVSLASDIYQYGWIKAPVYFPPILKEAKILEDNPNDDHAKKALKAILDNLQKDAQGYADHAQKVADNINNFSSDTEQDKLAFTGSEGKQGLLEYYDQKYGENSADVEGINKEIDAQRKILKAANDEYDHDVVVAATSPSYAWMFPIGTVAAAVVAGVYGKKAVDALNRARAAQAKINELTAKLAADANLMVAIHSAEIGMNTIVGNITEALPVIQKILGVWGGIADDLGNIVKIIDEDIRQVPPIIMDLGVDQAVEAWRQVALDANSYRVNAYVKQDSAKQSILSWKAETQFASSRLRSAVA